MMIFMVCYQKRYFNQIVEVRIGNVFAGNYDEAADKAGRMIGGAVSSSFSLERESEGAYSAHFKSPNQPEFTHTIIVSPVDHLMLVYKSTGL
jgi:hypothetical protein